MTDTPNVTELDRRFMAAALRLGHRHLGRTAATRRSAAFSWRIAMAIRSWSAAG